MNARNDDIERRLRASLEARADDVAPTPVLWQEVEKRVHRRRWMTRILSVGTVAAVLAIVAIVGPMFWPDGDSVPDILDEPDGPAVPSESAFLVTTDGQSIVLAEEDGAPVDALVERDPGTPPIVSVSIRPGSTRADLTLVYVTAGDPPSLHHLHFDGESVSTAAWPAHLGFTEPYAPATWPYPVWAPDGSHLAWVEFPWGQEDGGVSLRVIGWGDAGPGTGDPATDNTTIGLDEVPLTSVRLDAWVWDDVAADGVAARGRLHLTSRELEAWVVTVERQGDGAIALSPDATLLVEGDGSVLVSAAAGGGQLVYELEVRAGDEGGLAAEIVATGPGAPVARMPVPDGLLDAAEATDEGLSTIWMRAYGDTVVVGAGDRAWTVTQAGDVHELPGPVAHADVVSPRPPRDGPTTPPTGEPAASDTDSDGLGQDAGVPGEGPSVMLASGGRDLVLMDVVTGERQHLYELPEEGESHVVAIAVRPGSSPGDLMAVLLTRAEGMYDVRLFSYEHGYITFDPVEPAGNVGDVVPAPVWSPDGENIAWIVEGPGGIVVYVGTSVEHGARAGNAEFRVESYPTEIAALGPGARIQDWAWDGAGGIAQQGELVITSPTTGGGSGVSIVALAVERRPDGTVEVDPRPIAEPDHGPTYVDVAFGAHPASSGSTYHLRAEGASEGVVDFSLTSTRDASAPVALPFPEDLTRTSDPTSVWMNAWGETAVVGGGGEAWVVTLDGEMSPLGGTVWYADWLR